jgi:hypothetical protein
VKQQGKVFFGRDIPFAMDYVLQNDHSCHLTALVFVEKRAHGHDRAKVSFK